LSVQPIRVFVFNQLMLSLDMRFSFGT